MGRIAFATIVAFVSVTPVAAAQSRFTQRGFVDASVFAFPEDAPNDPTNLVADLLVREDASVKLAPWIQFAAGADLRANSHDQVEDAWRLDVADRSARRPRVSIRRLAATVTHGPFTIDVGKQFIRWGKTDILNPTDRFAPRDFVNLINADLLAVTGVRGVAQAGDDTFEVVWVPRFTPSRMPLLEDRWTVIADPFAGVRLADAGAQFPDGAQTGIRWGHVGAGVEYSLSFYNGFNHLPGVSASFAPVAFGSPPVVLVTRRYPEIRTYGGDAAAPTRWFTLKAEAAYFTSADARTDEYVLYVVQLERQTGEWMIVGGYAGEAVTARRATLQFAPDRGIAKSFMARTSYTIDTARSVALEAAIRQTGDGAYAKAEYSHARGQHWRATLSAVGIAGRSDDFLGQYRRNSHLTLALRYSF